MENSNKITFFVFLGSGGCLKGLGTFNLQLEFFFFLKKMYSFFPLHFKH